MIGARFKDGGQTAELHFPIPSEDFQKMAVAAGNGSIAFIIADGQEGAACVRAYQRMAGIPQSFSDLGYQVCYAGDLACTVLLNLIQE